MNARRVVLGGLVAAAILVGVPFLASARTAAGTPPPARMAAGDLDLMDNNLTKTYHCDGQVTVNGNHCNLTLDGPCNALVVNGNDNTIRVEGSIKAIATNGNRNAVIWSKAQNPEPPKISNPGTGNRITRHDPDAH